MYFRYLSYFKKKRFYRHKRHIAVNNFAVMNNIGILRVRANKVYLAIVNCGKITRVTLSFFRRMVKLTLEIQFVFCNFNRFRVYVDTDKISVRRFCFNGGSASADKLIQIFDSKRSLTLSSIAK